MSRPDRSLRLRILIALGSLSVTALLFVRALVWVATAFLPWLVAFSTGGDPTLGTGYAISVTELLALTASMLAVVGVASYRKLDDSIETESLAEADAPELHDRVRRLAATMDAPEPTIELVRSPLPNTLAVVRPSGSAIVVTDGLLSTLEGDELDAALAHELAHLKNRDALVMFVASLVFVASHSLLRVATAAFALHPFYGFVLLGPVILVCAVVQFPAFVVFGLLSRYREYAADAAAVRATGNPAALAAALQEIDDHAASLPVHDLRAQDRGFRALCLLPHGIPVTAETNDESVADRDDAASPVDWSDPASIRAMYDEQPLRQLARSDDGTDRPRSGSSRGDGAGDSVSVSEVILTDPWRRLTSRRPRSRRSITDDPTANHGNWKRIDRLEQDLSDQPLRDDDRPVTGRRPLSAGGYRVTKRLGDLLSIFTAERWVPEPHPPTEERIDRLRERAAALDRDDTSTAH
ncbi:M48 family metalloprotease [Halosolutus halophilus]|uniref:M48 family metalloprotease n=1 Tax=Halosolutus halophilus TaxID=1552990 RepID=UPI00223525A4|nr:M48 family metalloprotease [Halosolutus halophilus]